MAVQSVHPHRGGQALAIGLTVIVLSGLAAAAAGVHFDGLLDFHPGYSVSFRVPIVEGFVNWSVISVILVLVSLLVAPRTVRVIDIAGTQALARWPLLPAALACVPGPVREANDELVAAAARSDGDATCGGSCRGAVCRRLRDLDGLAHVEGVLGCLQPAWRPAVAIFVAALLAGRWRPSSCWSGCSGPGGRGCTRRKLMFGVA